MQGGWNQRGGHRPPRFNLQGGQNKAQMGEINIPPAVRMGQRVGPRLNQERRVPVGVPQHPVHRPNRNIQFGHNMHHGPIQGQNQNPRRIPTVNVGPPHVQAPAMQG